MKSPLQVFRETKYRMTLRIAYQKSSEEELRICLDELKKELNRRNKQQ